MTHWETSSPFSCIGYIIASPASNRCREMVARYAHFALFKENKLAFRRDARTPDSFTAHLPGAASLAGTRFLIAAVPTS
jgi:hypothetical protein